MTHPTASGYFSVSDLTEMRLILPCTADSIAGPRTHPTVSSAGGAYYSSTGKLSIFEVFMSTRCTKIHVCRSSRELSQRDRSTDSQYDTIVSSSVFCFFCDIARLHMQARAVTHTHISTDNTGSAVQCMRFSTPIGRYTDCASDRQ